MTSHCSHCSLNSDTVRCPQCSRVCDQLVTQQTIGEFCDTGPVYQQVGVTWTADIPPQVVGPGTDQPLTVRLPMPGEPPGKCEGCGGPLRGPLVPGSKQWHFTCWSGWVDAQADDLADALLAAGDCGDVAASMSGFPGGQVRPAEAGFDSPRPEVRRRVPNPRDDALPDGDDLP